MLRTIEVPYTNSRTFKHCQASICYIEPSISDIARYPNIDMYHGDVYIQEIAEYTKLKDEPQCFSAQRYVDSEKWAADEDYIKDLALLLIELDFFWNEQLSKDSGF